MAATSLCAAAACHATLQSDTLTIGNNLIERQFLWNNGNLITISLTDKARGVAHTSAQKTPDVVIVKNLEPTDEGEFSQRQAPADGVHAARLEVEVTCHSARLDVKRVFHIYDDCPAISSQIYLRGDLGAAPADDATSAGERKNIESAADMLVADQDQTIDRLELNGAHWKARAVEFWDVTDWNDNLVAEREFYSYRKTRYRGNLLIAANGVDRNGFFFIKEAPCSSVQLNYSGADFITDFGHFMVTGTGLTAADVGPGDWTRAYGCVTGVWGGSELDALKAIRAYQKRVRPVDPGRDEMIMVNTWGDRSQDSRVREDFCLKELDCMARLGATHFQIDDGWQTGKSPNSATAGGSFSDIYGREDYWTPDTAKFPRGLDPIVRRADSLGIAVGLWFNPSAENDFAHWENDARVIIGLYERYGIRHFKIDGLTVATKRAEENLRRLFDTVLETTGNNVVFNLDATASRREGYHYFNEYGNIFLENRYTDWGNYYPYRTLRNLWQLCRYVPSEKLQIETLNRARNTAKYSGDPFGPANYSDEYLLAITMTAQPLLWMETSSLPEDAYSIAPLVELYKSVWHDMHSGVTLPIGDEPSGRSWTGFQSLTSDNSGYVLIFREDNDREQRSITLWGDSEARYELTKIAGDGTCSAAPGGAVFSIPERNSFALYKYTITQP